MKNECQQYHLLMMKKLDGEITPSEEKELTSHIENCEACQEEMKEFINLKEATVDMKKQLLPEMAWDDYWRHLYNRIERGVSWILISVGAIILLTFGAYQFVLTMLGSNEMPGIVKVGVLALVIGLVVLIVSVVREKLMVRKHDQYKEVER